MRSSSATRSLALLIFNLASLNGFMRLRCAGVEAGFYREESRKRNLASIFGALFPVRDVDVWVTLSFYIIMAMLAC